MRPDDIRQLLRRQPYERFRICLLDGSSYDIRDPDLVAVGKSTLQIGFPAARLPIPLSDREVIIALLHISRLEPIE